MPVNLEFLIESERGGYEENSVAFFDVSIVRQWWCGLYPSLCLVSGVVRVYAREVLLEKVFQTLLLDGAELW